MAVGQLSHCQVLSVLRVPTRPRVVERHLLVPIRLVHVEARDTGVVLLLKLDAQGMVRSVVLCPLVLLLVLIISKWYGCSYT